MNADHALPTSISPSLVIHDAGLPGLIACWLEARRCDGLTPHDPASPDANHQEVSGRGVWSATAPVAWFPSAVHGLDPLSGAPTFLPSADWAKAEHATQARNVHAARRRTLESHFKLCPLAGLSDHSPLCIKPSHAVETSASYSRDGFDTTLMLMAALAAAADLGRTRVIWPVMATSQSESGGADISAIADACDRAMLAAQLMTIDLSRTPAHASSSRPGSSSIEIQTPFIDMTDDELIELGLDAGVPLTHAWWCSAPKPRSPDAQHDQSALAQCGTCQDCKRWIAAIQRLCGNAALTEPKAPPITITSAAKDLLDREHRR